MYVEETEYERNPNIFLENPLFLGSHVVVLVEPMY